MPEIRITNNGLIQSGISDPAGGGIATLPASSTVTVEVDASVLSRILPQLADLRARQLPGGGDAFLIEFLDEVDSPADYGGIDASVYGQMSIDAGVGTQNVSSGLAPVICNQLTNVFSENKNITVDAPNGLFTALKKGVYRFHYHIAFVSDGSTADPTEYTFRLVANGVPVPGSLTHSQFFAATSKYTVGCECIGQLEVGDDVGIEVVSASANTFTFDVEHGSFTIELVAELFD